MCALDLATELVNKEREYASAEAEFEDKLRSLLDLLQD